MSNENTGTTTVAATAITMKDGRVVDFGARNKLKKSIDVSGNGAERVAVLTIDVNNGETFKAEVTLAHPLLLELAAHGLSQKITDSVTKAETPEDIALGVQNQINQINAGTWSQRAGGGSSEIIRGFSVLVEAIARIKSIEKGSDRYVLLQNKLLQENEASLKSYKSNAQVKMHIAAIEAERATEKAAKAAAGIAVTDEALKFEI
jgi:hypothetical protein